MIAGGDGVSWGRSLNSVVRRLVCDECGQDQIEYALLTAVVVFAGIAGFDAIRTSLGSAYTVWLGAINGLWESPAPGS